MNDSKRCSLLEHYLKDAPNIIDEIVHQSQIFQSQYWLHSVPVASWERSSVDSISAIQSEFPVGRS
jgi:hypothetical protein